MNHTNPGLLRQAGIICACSVFLVSLNLTAVFADEVTVANDTTGADSTNQAESSISNQTNIQSSNQSNVTNIVNLNLNTGQNQASQNQASNNISSGDIAASVSLQTQTNQNQASLTSPSASDPSTSQITNSQTGADSTNQAGLNLNNQTQIVHTNQQNIVNDITINANTGQNQAKQNGGQVNLSTGDIQIAVHEQTNGNLNQIQLPSCSSCSFNYQVNNHKTGFGSTNITQTNFNSETNIFQTTQSSIINQVNINADTGHNQASDNQGPVMIDTGSITIGVTVETLANLNEVVWENPHGPTPPDDVEVGGPDEPDHPDQPNNNGLPAASTNNSNNSSGGSNNSSGGGSSPAAIGGQILGAVLPATGSPYNILIWMLGLFLISMGRFVRLNAGRSPAIAYA